MELLKKIWTGLVATIDALVGLPTDDNEYIIGIISLGVIAVIIVVSSILITKLTKWERWVRNLTVIGITVAFVFVFCSVCLIIDH